MATTTSTAKKPATRVKEVFTAEERAAMKAAVADRKRGKVTRADGEAELLAAVAKLDPADRTMAERVHAIVTAAAPNLWPRTWYGMPAYAKDEKIICHFQPATKFKTRYATLGFSDKARLDDGNMWANAFALAKLTPDVEARIAALIKQAVS